MRETILPLILALLLPAGCAAPADAPAGSRLADAEPIPAATPIGEPRQCVPLPIRETRVRSDRVIDFVRTGRQIYRVTLLQPCPGLGFERRFTYATSLNQLCAQDIITVLYQTGPIVGASCGLAPFQPVRLATRR